jgi:homoserine dehydrogenase
MIGFGTVGQEFVRLLQAKRSWLLSNKGMDVEVLAISTTHHGSLLSKNPLDLEKVMSHLRTEGTLKGFGLEDTNLSPIKIIENCDADIMVELTTLNIDTGQPAIDYIKRAFEVGMDVITANKGPVAFAYKDLRNLARARGVHFRFEPTVMDGTPIFNLAEKTLQGCEVISLTGILNSTSNFVLSEMARGRTMQEAIKEAQTRGFAEADPSLDIDGWDASAKITALANVLMDADLTPKNVDRKGIRDIGREEVEDALSQGKKVKLIARAWREDDSVRLSVKPEVVEADNIFWSVDGTSSGLTIKTDLMGDISILEGNPLVTQTAYGVLSDLLLVVDGIRHNTI